MAEQQEPSLIGYDPLAWMHENSSEADQATKIDEVDLSEDIAIQTSDMENTISSTVDEVGVDLQMAKELESVPTLIVNDNDAAAIALDAVLNIQNVARLHQRLLAIIDKHDKIEIDASEVMAVDTASMQLLLVFKQTALKMQKSVSFDFPSDKFIEAAELLGISAMLEVDNAASGFF